MGVTLKQPSLQYYVSASSKDVHVQNASQSGAEQENFQGGWGFVEQGHFDKHFVKNTTKIEPTGKKFGVCFS